MGSDRARVSYDPKQQYRSVVMQQGRVTLEADWNESQQITNEEIRREALDFVGPCGTPDNGYNVVTTSAPTYPPFDFYVKEGTMYVGGMRAHLIEPVQYSNQPNWQDYGAEDPDWVDLSSFYQVPPVNEFIYLYLREQEVSAVEDPDLKDVALGGPDTAERGRLLQRVMRVSSQGADCASGLAAAQTRWQGEGLLFDPDTMRLTSSSTLAVSAADQQSTQGPCQPQAQGGYVDPDNQLIRVQISGIDELTGNPKFLWGFDDASFLYRIDVDPNNPENLILQSAPVDNYHQPVRGQAVEVLRTAAELPNGGFVAATSGFVFTLDQNYNTDAQSVILPSGVTLPSDYLAARQSPSFPLFLRVWQEEKVFTSGVSTVLGDTGLQVTLETNGGVFHTGDYWMFAVRPATPQTVYPERYWNNFQPPDGPRLWACPLGVIAWTEKRVGTVVSDCRNQFDNLVDLTRKQEGCCTVTVRPQDITETRTLQSIVNGASNPTMLVEAVDQGIEGNNIAVAVTNVQSNISPPTFDFTVTETDTLSALTVATIDGILGDETTGSLILAHVLKASVSQDQNAVPAGNQTYSLSNAQTPSAQVDIFDNAGNVVFTLEAKRPGDDGSLTSATISNINTTVTPNTFDLTLTWTKTLPGLSLANFRENIQAGMAYEVIARVAPKRPPAFPVEGVTMLTGGTLGNTPTAASAIIFGSPTTICLRPGSYNLPESLEFGLAQSNLTIEACGGGVTIAAASGQESGFIQGLILLTGNSNVTLRGLTFAMPQVSVFSSGAKIANLDRATLEGIGEHQLSFTSVSVGIRAIDCQSLTVEGCTFNFPPLEGTVQEYAGILAGGECLGLSVQGNSFQGPADFVAGAAAAGSIVVTSMLIAGYLQASSIQFGGPPGSLDNGTATPSTIDGAFFRDNYFQSLSIPVLLDCAVGTVRFDANVVRSSYVGILVESSSLFGQIDQVSRGVNKTIGEALGVNSARNIFQRGMALAAGYPLPASYTPRNTIVIKAGAEVVPQSNNADAIRSRVESVLSFFKQSVDGAPNIDAALKATEGDALSADQHVEPLTARMSQLLATTVERGFDTPQGPVVLNVQITNNDIDAIISQSLGGGVAVEVFEIDKSTSSMVTMTGNKLRNQSPTSPTVEIYMVARCVITGNLILNEQAAVVSPAGAVGQIPPSLMVVAIPVTTVYSAYQSSAIAIAVTGNVFRGQPTLPARAPSLPNGLGNLPSPMDRWEAYNTEV